MSVVEQNSPVSEAEARARIDGLDGHKLVVAVSGGPDSMALLYLLAKVSSDRSNLLAVTIDHGLRAESAAEAKSVAAFAAGMNIAHRTMRWSGGKPRSGLQEAARAARYRLLRDAARDFEARRIVTAHHLEDQAETVLLRLSRGSGLSGLKAMAKSVPMDGCTLLRPLLDMPKARLIATLDQAKISYADDPSNRDPRFTRARLRALMPLLAAEGLEAKRLAQFARRVARADAALEAAVAAAEHEVGPADATTIDVDWTWFTGLSDEIALRLLGRLIARKGGEVSLGKLEILFTALQGQAHRVRRTLAGALVTRTPGLLSIETAPARRIKTAQNQSKAAMFECETPRFVAG